MADAVLSPLDIIEGASIRGRKGVFVLGCFDQRITFYTQQVRAIALVHALADQDYLKDGPRVAVIGGGAAGLSAAAALALASSGQVVLFEEAQNLLKLQSGTDRRRLDPHIYNWPRLNAADPVADLPILDWEAGPSNQVREEVVRQFEDIAARTGNRLTKHMRCRVTGVAAANQGYELTLVNVDTGAERTEQFQMVFLAFGFGLEPTESIQGINDRSYWDNAGVPGVEFQGRPNPQYFISGNGDGGLIDFVASAAADFNHAEMIRTITNYPGLVPIERELLSIEKGARQSRAAGADFDLYDAYNDRLARLVDGNGLVGEIGRRLRPGVHLILQTRGPSVFSLDSSILNRFAVYLTIRACLGTAGCGFSHRQCDDVSRVDDYMAAAGDAPFQLDCDGELLAVDEVIIRHGTNKAVVRQPFAGILDDYDAQHKAWLKRLGEVTLIPALSNDAQDFYRNLANRAHLPGSQRRIRLAQAAMPVAIHISADDGRVRWAGDRVPDQVTDAWDAENLFSITLAQDPDELGAVGGAILRVAAHVPHLKVHADPLAWAERWKQLTTGSLHASGMPMPILVGGNPGGAAQLRHETGAPRLATIVHRRLDNWMLERINEHLSNFAVSGADPGGAIGLVIAADLRARMGNTWQTWHEAFQDDPVVLARFLRLMISATDEDDDAVQVLVGPKKLTPIICGTALSLAMASVWGDTEPHAIRPGNLLRRIAETERTGHGCAADRIMGRRVRYSAEAHDWKTSFVLLAVEGALDLATQADMAFTVIEEPRQPSLADPSGAGPLMMWISEPLIEALSEGTDALVALLEQVERRRERPMVNAIEYEVRP